MMRVRSKPTLLFFYKIINGTILKQVFPKYCKLFNPGHLFIHIPIVSHMSSVTTTSQPFIY